MSEMYTAIYTTGIQVTYAQNEEDLRQKLGEGWKYADTWTGSKIQMWRPCPDGSVRKQSHDKEAT